MRFPLLLTTLWLATLGEAVASPPGYRAPRRRYSARHLAYIRPPGRIHASVNLGYYNGDLTNNFSDNTFRVGYGLGFTQALSPHLTFSTELAMLYLKAKDHYPARGYRFDSNNGLLHATLRYNIFEDKSMYVGLNKKPSPAQLFVEAGAGLLLTDPTAYQADGAGAVQQLPAETGSSYPQLAAVFPVGIGGTLKATPHLYFTLDALYYFTTTDVLDDFSQRANPKQPDNFATLTLKVEYAFGKKKPRTLVHYD